jgi:hypothetical protein
MGATLQVVLALEISRFDASGGRAERRRHQASEKS